MLQVLNSSASIQQAISSLSDEYSAEPAVLRCDLQNLVEQLLKHGLIEIV